MLQNFHYEGPGDFSISRLT